MTDEALVLRPTTSADLDELWSVFWEIIEAGDSYSHDRKTTKDEFIDYWTGRGGEQWTAVQRGKVLGGFTLRPVSPGRGAHIGTASYIVAANARGSGVGATLATHSVERATAIGFAGIQFNMVVSTNEPAVSLWKKFGFEIVGRIPRAFLHETRGYVDTFVMFRPLDPIANNR